MTNKNNQYLEYCVQGNCFLTDIFLLLFHSQWTFILNSDGNFV